MAFRVVEDEASSSLPLPGLSRRGEVQSRLPIGDLLRSVFVPEETVVVEVIYPGVQEAFYTWSRILWAFLIMLPFYTTLLVVFSRDLDWLDGRKLVRYLESRSRRGSR